MESILSKVDFETHGVYKVEINLSECDMYDDLKAGTFDEDGQDLGIVADLRRSIKGSFPLEYKKIIKTILPHEEKLDENDDAYRDIDIEYFLVMGNDEIEEFCTTELHDELEQEWHNGSTECKITISAYGV